MGIVSELMRNWLTVYEVARRTIWAFSGWAKGVQPVTRSSDALASGTGTANDGYRHFLGLWLVPEMVRLGLVVILE